MSHTTAEKSPRTVRVLLTVLVLTSSACGGASQGGTRSASPASTGYAGGEEAASYERAESLDEDGYMDEDVPASTDDYGGVQVESESAPEPAAPPAPMRRPVAPTQATATAGGATPGEEPTVTIDVGPRFSRLLSLEGDLGGVLALSTPDCPRARDLTDAMCELSEHICTIADDNPDSRDARVRCRDGRDRCVRAHERLDDSCGD